MAPGIVCDGVDINNMEKVFYNHFANAIINEEPIYCIWEFKVGISTEEFQKFIDDPTGPGFCIDVLINICKLIDRYLLNGQTPYPRVFFISNWLNLLKLR